MLRLLLLSLLSTLPLWASAGRPLATDDAGTAAAGSCQVEAWAEKTGGDGARVLAPACGLAAGIEGGVEYRQPRPRGPVRGAGALALKWVPDDWKVETRAGEVNFGLKASAGWVQPAGGRWQRGGGLLLGLLSWSPDPAWSAHANLGAARDTASASSAALLNLALVWTPAERLLLVVETLRNDRRDVFGGAFNGVAARWWLVKDTLGLDLSAGRESGSGGPTQWTLGLGWYGIGL